MGRAEQEADERKAGGLEAGDLKAGDLKAGSLVKPTPELRAATGYLLIGAASQLLWTLQNLRDRQYKNNHDVLDSYLDSLQQDFQMYLWLQQCSGLVEIDEGMQALAVTFDDHLRALKIRLEVLRRSK